MFNSTGDKQDFCGNFVPSQPHHHHHHHSGWGLDQITQRPLDVSIQSTSGRVAQGHPDVENKLYCQGNYGVPFYSSHSSAIRSSCEGSSAKQNEHRIGLQLGAEEMASSLSTATPNTSKINSDVHSNSDKISTDGNGTIVNCLQCNFSGDSLDLNQEDGPVAMQRSGKEVDLHDRRSLSHPEGDTGQKRKTLDSNSQIGDVYF